MSGSCLMVEQTWGGHLSMELPYLVYKVVQFQYQFLSINVNKTHSFLKQPLVLLGWIILQNISEFMISTTCNTHLHNLLDKIPNISRVI